MPAGPHGPLVRPRGEVYTKSGVTHMRNNVLFCAAFAAVALVLSGAPATAQQRSAGDKIVYSVQMSNGGNAKQAMTSKVTVNIDKVNADGTAHANVVVDGGGGSAHMPQMKSEATITKAGEIIAKTPSELPKAGFPVTQAAAEKVMNAQMAAAGPGMLEMNLRSFNGFAAAVGARKQLKIGDTWRAPSPSDSRETVVYKVTGREQHLGHDAFVITLQSTPDASTKVSAQGYYDDAAHLVVGLHYEEQAQMGTTVTDVALAS